MSATVGIKRSQTTPFRHVDWGAVVIVSMITAMIWLFAESESLTRGQHEARIRFVDTTGERTVRVVSPGWDQTVSLTVQGPTAAVQRATAMFMDGFTLALGQPGVPDVEGEQAVDLRTALRSDEHLAGAGLTVLDCEPATVLIRVESLVELPDTEVVADIQGVELAEPAVIEPSRVTVRAPIGVIEELKALAGGPRVIARCAAGSLEALNAGAKQTADARLSLPGSLAAARDVQITPSSAKLRLTIKGRKESVKVASAPVQVLLPPHELDNWRVEINPEDRLIKDVTITGPAELVAQVREGRIPVVAVLSISSDELQARIASKPIDFWRLPAGLVVDGGDAPVRLTIEPRSPQGTATSPLTGPPLPQ